MITQEAHKAHTLDIPLQLAALHEIGWSWLAMSQELSVTRDTIRKWRRGVEPTMPSIVSRALTTLEGQLPPGRYRQTADWWFDRQRPEN